MRSAPIEIAGIPILPMRFALRIPPAMLAAALLACAPLWTSCSRLEAVASATLGEFAKARADRAARAIIAQKQTGALGKPGEIDIEPASDPLTEKILADAERLDWSKDTYTTPSCLLSLADAFAVALANNRDYKSRRETVYAQALALTETRRDYQPLFSASAHADVTRTDLGHESPAGGNVERFGSRGFSAGVTQLLATGARVSLDFSHDFVRYFTHEARASASNSLSFSAVQPLLRGAGRLVARENLLQGEREMIYTVRDFRRFQQGFVIDVADRYYRLLSAQDQLRNARTNYRSAEANWRELKRLAEGGRRSDLEVDQARQALLEAEVRLSRTEKDYARQLDLLKIFLGLPIDLDVGPDSRELDRVAERGLLRPDMGLSEAVDVALAERLDLKTIQDRVEDRRRAVRIALRNFLPTLDARYGYSTSTGDEKDRVKLDFRDNTQEWGMNLGVPFDWTPRRNDYRLAEIALQEAERSLDLFRDQLILEVRDAWRELENARTDYRVQREAVLLAERRVRRASLFLQSGRSIARDLLEAEDDLLASRDALTHALVNHTIQRLRFWNAVERLEVDEKGLWVGEGDAGAPGNRPDAQEAMQPGMKER
ncbi:MAG TPA: TolC family protein [Sumerlaeia bacterium]|nr:TolC family protein [Sumerlaeia bacterium]